MSTSEYERISHVVRRLGMGGHGPAVGRLTSVEEAIADSLSLDGDEPSLPSFPVPQDLEEARNRNLLGQIVSSWLEAMRTPQRRVAERLTWFWHDHFAVSARKVGAYNLLANHLTMLRSHAVGRFDALLRATATDGAMLIYLDGATNSAGQVNENYAREVMELHTIGLGQYDQADITEAARALTGWVLAIPGGRRPIPDEVEPWASVFAPFRHDAGTKTILGATGSFDLEDLIDLLLDHPETARHVAGKLYTHLVGSPPDEATTTHLASVFSGDWEILRLVEEIVAHPAFTADESIRSKVRTPIERALTIAQGFRRADDRLPEDLPLVLARLGYVPLAPPNPAGFPPDSLLLGPYQLTHSLDLLNVATEVDAMGVDEVLAGLGLYDVSRPTRLTLERAEDPATLIALAASSPEFALT